MEHSTVLPVLKEFGPALAWFTPARTCSLFVVEAALATFHTCGGLKIDFATLGGERG